MNILYHDYSDLSSPYHFIHSIPISQISLKHLYLWPAKINQGHQFDSGLEFGGLELHTMKQWFPPLLEPIKNTSSDVKDRAL